MGCREMIVVSKIELAQNVVGKNSEGIDVRHRGCGKIRNIDFELVPGK
jgi:hypothetical protein